MRRAMELASALLLSAEGDRAGARRILEAAIQRAREKGSIAWELEARRALSDIEKPGAASPERARLARDAAAQGFALVARKANEAASLR